MLSPEAFEEAYPAADLEAELPDSPVASLRDLQYLYGKLYTLATAGGGDYAAYLTPDAARDLVDTDDSLIVVRVDLSGDEPRLAEDGDGPVRVTRYTDERVSKVAHCKYPAARGIDHSVTHQAGRNSDPEKLARYANERLSKWAHDDEVQTVAADHEQGWIVDALATLGEDEDVRETIAEAVERELGGASTTALLTVQVRLDDDGDYLWPGELDVFMAAMRARKLSKLVSKGQASDSSGTAVDLVTGERTRTVGTSEDPQNYYLGKQLETFPGLDVEEAWRTHPVSEDAAVTLMNAETFVEACTYRTFGAKVYSLPYFFGTPTPEETYELYRMLYLAATEDDDANVTPVERAYERHGDATDLRFYVSAVMPHQMSRYDVFGETLNGRIQYPAELARSHAAVLQTSAFRGDGDRSAAMPTHEDRLLVSDAAFLGPVASGRYFAETFPHGDDDTDASADDPRIEALVDVLSGTPIPVSLLLDAYVERIVEAESADWFPSFRVAAQFAQLCALASADGRFLDADDGHELLARPPTYDTRTMTSREELAITDGGFAGDRKLASFIEETPALQHDQRCGVFLLGALVGAVGNYQEWHEDRSTTLVDQFPVKSLTTTRVKKVAQDAIEKTLTYTRQEKKREGRTYPGTKFDYIVERLRERVLRPDPDEWDLEKSDLRFYYALGITYGMNDYSPATDDETTADEATEDD
ncbi:type I-B CRISPR-associated protein Cas8b/Csh1 (plasmid) [Halarchaeum sp. CBA1220]|uniref:type I-B CRISPR-associated protein Cas8b/Csh1 n=1 Tax=Halarchaeum sp. CBA1220 TaxID=1853682 RepID=UPI000F3A8100|nr:type I-B CRISPR-associated protein Cas8b/Csh1 [Halarchaeum sp. CBA1220]QLC35055.1 type I-B CRISPR-associated protein Cas8b/Csh1 [Halarchaeum sp. CBA1220]